MDFNNLHCALIQRILLEFKNRSNDTHAEVIVQTTSVFIRVLADCHFNARHSPTRGQLPGADGSPPPDIETLVTKGTDTLLLALYPDLAENAERRKSLVKVRNAIIEKSLNPETLLPLKEVALRELDQWLSHSQAGICFGVLVGGLLDPYAGTLNPHTLGMMGQNVELHLRSLAAHLLREKRDSISGRETLEIDLISLSRKLFDYLILELPEPATSHEIVVLALLIIADTYTLAHYERLYGEGSVTESSNLEIGNLYKALISLGGRVLVGIETRGPIDSATAIEAQQRITDTFKLRTSEYDIRSWTTTMLNPTVTSEAAFHTGSLLTDFGRYLNWGRELSEKETLYLYQTLLHFVLEKQRQYQTVTSEEFQVQLH